MKRLSILTMVALLAGVASYAQPGTLDPTFNAAQALPAGSHLFALALQPDGKLIGGSTLLNRFHDDGSLDLSYNINRAFFNGTIGSLRLQPDNKLLVGGIFSQFGGQPAGKLIRLNDDGTRDLAFNAGGAGFTTSSFFMFLPAIEIQPDGKILAGGGFSAYNGVSQNRLSRLNPDGSLDATFNIGTGFDYDVNDIVYHNGKILVGGNFMNYKGVPAQNLIRLEENGNVDNSFNIKAGFNFGVNGSYRCI
jgi:uncharacterized delta-60 repeat protein